MFEQVEAFWTARGTDDAVGFAQQALAALNDLGDAAVGQNLAGARAAITVLRGTCQSCHENHREQTDDGYRIKSGS
jgi:cytochrome c556